MIIIFKLMLMFFILGFIMIGIAGFTFCIKLVQKLNSTIRIMVYTEITILVLITFCMDLSFRGIPIFIFYWMGFIFVGICSIPIRIFMGDY